VARSEDPWPKLGAAVGRQTETAQRSDETSPSTLSASEAKVLVVMPARNAARTLEQTVSAIPTDVVNEIILVDDKSTDGTLEVARRLPLHLIWHPHNVGYGGNQKTCYLEALQRGADVVVMLHPDGQYEPALIPRMVEPILRGEADMVLGSRLAEPGAWRTSGMPRYKFLANRGLTMVENAVLGTDFSELHTGYRAYSRKLLLTVPFLRNSIDFVFDSEMVMQAVHFGFRIVEVPARTRYFPEASSASAGQSIVYGVKTLGAAGRLVLHRSGALRSRKFMP
jgi:glycosyltransferase involved in cell wall biosynthesis